MGIQAFVADAAVEAFDVTVLDRLARLNETQFDAVIGRPRIERPTPEFTAIVEGEPRRRPARSDHGLEGPDDGHARQGVRHGDPRCFARAVIDHRETPAAPPGRQLIADEVDAPGVVRLRDDGSGDPWDGDPLAPPLQAIEDSLLARGINRIRHWYTEVAADIEPYFVHSTHDDLAGLMADMAAKRSRWQTALTTYTAIAFVNSVLLGALAGVIAAWSFRMSARWALATACVAFGASGWALYSSGDRLWREADQRIPSRFPTSGAKGEP